LDTLTRAARTSKGGIVELVFDAVDFVVVRCDVFF
jgi:hypothetical protein